MKAFLTSLALLPIFAASASAGSAYFTTVFFDDEDVIYVGLKNRVGAGDAQVISFPFLSNDRTSFPLPEEISHRDVIGLITEKQKLFVLTNGMGVKGDGPMLHVYDRKKLVWSKVGKVDCPAFTRVDLHPKRMIFSCEVGKSRKGKSKLSRKVLSFGRQRIYRRGTWRFPEFLLRYRGKTAVLEGDAPKWDTLRLRSESGQRTISAWELFQPPTVATPAKP